MNLSPARLAVLSIALSLAVTACKPANEAATPAADAGASAPTAVPAGDKVAAEITGAGATFVYPILSKWSDEYHKATGNKNNNQSIGSGGGIAPIKAATLEFGSSDQPVPKE